MQVDKVEIDIDDESNEFLMGRVYQGFIRKLGGEPCGEWLICSDDAATRRTKEYIENSLWAFNADFLSTYTGLDIAVFEALQPACEDGNLAVRSIIDKTGDFDEFADEAISCDGRGHFLSTYDGEEREFDVAGETYYYYRMN